MTPIPLLVHSGSPMTSLSSRLRLFGLIQDLQKEAADLGLTRTAAALEVTTAVAMEELSDHSATPSMMSEERETADDEST